MTEIIKAIFAVFIVIMAVYIQLHETAYMAGETAIMAWGDDVYDNVGQAIEDWDTGGDQMGDTLWLYIEDESSVWVFDGTMDTVWAHWDSSVQVIDPWGYTTEVDTSILNQKYPGDTTTIWDGI